MPPMNDVIQTAMATPRWWSSWNMLLIRASVDGISVAPAMPSSARVTISISGPVEYAAATDATANALPPIISSRRRPIRSPSVPIVIRKPAIMKPYTSMIHSCWVLLAPRSADR